MSNVLDVCVTTRRKVNGADFSAMLPVLPDDWPVPELIRLLGEVYLLPAGHLQISAQTGVASDGGSATQ